MSDRTEEQIRLGLRLLADDVKVPSRTRAPLRPWRALAVAVGVAMLIAAVAFGVLGRSSSTGSPFLPDAYNYRPASASYMPGGVFQGNGGPPAYETAELSAVAASSRKDAWIIGSLGWHWDGTSWRNAPFPRIGYGGLLSVASVSPRDAWATGPTDAYLVESQALIAHWDGTAWTARRVPGLGPTDLFSVSAAGRRNVWVGGATYRKNRVGRMIPSATRPLLLRWDGAAWRKVILPWAAPGLVLDRVVATPSGVWAVVSGQEETPTKHLAMRIVVEYWNGEHWQSVRAPFGPNDPIAGFSATSGEDAWAVGSYAHGGTAGMGYSQSLAAHWNGASWQIAPVPDRPGHNDSALLDVVAVRPDDAWALGMSEHLEITGPGTDGSIASAVATPPVALLEHWDGRRWQVMPGVAPQLSPPEPGFALAVSKDGSAWAVGEGSCDNAVLRWTGRAWVFSSHPPDRKWRLGLLRHHDLPSCQASRG